MPKMSRKDYIRAAEIVRNEREDDLAYYRQIDERRAPYIEDAFVLLFKSAPSLFNESKFRAACQVQAK